MQWILSGWLKHLLSFDVLSDPCDTNPIWVAIASVGRTSYVGNRKDATSKRVSRKACYELQFKNRSVHRLL